MAALAMRPTWPMHHEWTAARVLAARYRLEMIGPHTGAVTTEMVKRAILHGFAEYACCVCQLQGSRARERAHSSPPSPRGSVVSTNITIRPRNVAQAGHPGCIDTSNEDDVMVALMPS
jgi:hypothetical protein